MTDNASAKDNADISARADYRTVPHGHTRNCFFPWDTVFIHADRTVRACCTSAVIDSVGADWDLEALANGANFREFRRRFYEGDLTPECMECSIKAVVPIAEFRRLLTAHLRAGPQGKVESP